MAQVAILQQKVMMLLQTPSTSSFAPHFMAQVAILQQKVMMLLQQYTGNKRFRIIFTDTSIHCVVWS
jgi:hypothetical protein